MSPPPLNLMRGSSVPICYAAFQQVPGVAHWCRDYLWLGVALEILVGGLGAHGRLAFGLAVDDGSIHDCDFRIGREDLGDGG